MFGGEPSPSHSKSAVGVERNHAARRRQCTLRLDGDSHGSGLVVLATGICRHNRQIGEKHRTGNEYPTGPTRNHNRGEDAGRPHTHADEVAPGPPRLLLGETPLSVGDRMDLVLMAAHHPTVGQDVPQRSGTSATIQRPWPPEGGIVVNRTYALTELVGTSSEGVDAAIRNAVARAATTIGKVDWFEVVQVRGYVRDGDVDHFQVTIKVGARLEDS